MANLTKNLRQMLRQALPTSSDLDAFCIDHYPAIAQRLSPGMDRLDKENLLLQIADSAKLSEQLNRMICAASTKEVALSEEPRPPKIETAGALIPAPSRVAIGLSLISGLAIIGSLAGLGLHRTRQSEVPSFPPNSPTANTAIPRTLRTVPAGASVYFANDGRYLGKTPLILDPAWKGSLCVKKDPGYLLAVDLDRGDLPEILQLHLAPVGELSKKLPEECHVPTRILE